MVNIWTLKKKVVVQKQMPKIWYFINTDAI